MQNYKIEAMDDKSGLGFGKVKIVTDPKTQNEKVWVTGIRVIKDKQLGFFFSNPANPYTGGFKDYNYQYNANEAIRLLHYDIIDDIIIDPDGGVYCAIYKDRNYAAKANAAAKTKYKDAHFAYTVVTTDTDRPAYVNRISSDLTYDTSHKYNNVAVFGIKKQAETCIQYIYQRANRFKGIDADQLGEMIKNEKLTKLDVLAVEHAVEGIETLRVLEVLV